jgi:hypothetical protein
LYGRETGLLELREEHVFLVLENGVIRRIFGPKRDEVTGAGGGCIVRSSIIHTLRQTLFGYQTKGDELSGQARMDIMRNAYKILAVKREQKKTLGRCSRR